MFLEDCLGTELLLREEMCTHTYPMFACVANKNNNKHLFRNLSNCDSHELGKGETAARKKIFNSSAVSWSAESVRSIINDNVAESIS